MTQQEIYRLQIPEGYRPVLDLLKRKRPHELEGFLSEGAGGGAVAHPGVGALLFARKPD